MPKHYTVTRMVPEQTLKSLYHNLSEHLRQGQGHRCPSSWWWWCCPPGLPPSPPSHSSPAHRPQLQESQRWIPDLKESFVRLPSRSWLRLEETWGTGVLLNEECWLWCCPWTPWAIKWVRIVFRKVKHSSGFSELYRAHIVRRKWRIVVGSISQRCGGLRLPLSVPRLGQQCLQKYSSHQRDLIQPDTLSWMRNLTSPDNHLHWRTGPHCSGQNRLPTSGRHWSDSKP